MKKLKATLICLIFVICNSCSRDNNFVKNNEVKPRLTNYIYKSYDANTGSVLDSITYTIVENKIIKVIKSNSTNNDVVLTNFIYVNNILTETKSYLNNVLTNKTLYTYNSENDIIEYLKENIDNSNQNIFFERHKFQHSTDTIFSITERSNDGINYNSIINEHKIILDSNNNRIFYEKKDNINNETTYKSSNYDNNNNLLNEDTFNKLQNQNDALILSTNHTFNTGDNLFYLINSSTYGKRNLMLTYHLQNNAINNFNAKSISPNALNGFFTSFGNGSFNFQITNNFNQNNLVIYSDFKTTVSGNLISHFSQEYTLD